MSKPKIGEHWVDVRGVIFLVTDTTDLADTLAYGAGFFDDEFNCKYTKVERKAKASEVYKFRKKIKAFFKA